MRIFLYKHLLIEINLSGGVFVENKKAVFPNETAMSQVPLYTGAGAYTHKPVSPMQGERIWYV